MNIEAKPDYINELRYRFEHVLLPGWFYDYHNDFIKEISTSSDNVDKIFFKLCLDENIEDKWLGKFENSYAYDEDNDINVIIIVCPEVEMTPNCKYIFMLYNKNGRLVFNLEYDNSMMLLGKNIETFMICSWDEKKCHTNYGPFNGDDYELLQKIKKYFLDKFDKKK